MQMKIVKSGQEHRRKKRPNQKKQEVMRYRENLGYMYDLKRRKNPAYKDYEKKTSRARRTVNSISDPIAKEAAKMKWIEPIGESLSIPTWEEIARRFGDTMSGEAIRKRVHRSFEQK